MEKLKNATKRIAAIGASALMLSSAAFAGGLGDYPNNFVSNNTFEGQVVIGATAQSIDATSAASIIEDLKNQFSGDNEQVKISYKKTSSDGGESIDAVRSNTGLNYGETLADVSETTGFDDQDTNILAELSFDNGVSDEDYEQSLKLNNGIFNYALRDSVDNVDKISDGIFYTNGQPFATYTFDLKSGIEVDSDASGGLSSTEKAEFIGETLTIMGNEFTISDLAVDSGTNEVDKLILVGGANKISLGEGDSQTLTIEGKSYEVAVQSVSSTKVLLTVNGESKSVDDLDTEEIGGVNIAVTDLVESSRDSVKGYAEIVIGGQKVTLESNKVKINDDDVNDMFIGYEVDVTFTSNVDGLDKFEITFEVDDDMLLTKGDSLDDVLFGAFSLVYEGTNEPDYTTVELRVSDDDIIISGTTEDGESFNRPMLHMGDKNVGTTEVWVPGDQDADRIIFAHSKVLTGPNVGNVTAGFDLTINNIEGSGFLLTKDDEEQYLYEISNIDIDAYNLTNDETHEADFDEILRNDAEDNIDATEWNTKLGYVLGAAAFTNAGADTTTFTLNNLVEAGTQYSAQSQISFENNLIMALGPNTESAALNVAPVSLEFSLDSSDVNGDDTVEESENVMFNFTWDASDKEFNIDTPIAVGVVAEGAPSLGTDFTNAGNEDNEDGTSDIQTFVTKYGIMIEYENEDDTWAKIMVPEEQVEGTVSLVFGNVASESGSVTVAADLADDKKAELEADGYTITDTETIAASDVTFSVSSVVLDSEVSGASDMIVVGGPVVNAVARTLLRVAAYDAATDANVQKEGDAVAMYFADENSVLVYGYTGADTAAVVSKLNAGSADFK